MIPILNDQSAFEYSLNADGLSDLQFKLQHHQTLLNEAEEQRRIASDGMRTLLNDIATLKPIYEQTKKDYECWEYDRNKRLWRCKGKIYTQSQFNRYVKKAYDEITTRYDAMNADLADWNSRISDANLKIAQQSDIVDRIKRQIAELQSNQTDAPIVQTPTTTTTKSILQHSQPKQAIESVEPVETVEPVEPVEPIAPKTEGDDKEMKSMHWWIIGGIVGFLILVGTGIGINRYNAVKRKAH